MQIAFLGGGTIATTIATLAKAAGHDSRFGVRKPNATDTSDFPRMGFEAAIVDADLVFIAVPYLATTKLLPGLADALAGKIVVDTSNAVKADWSPLPTGEESSGAEHIQALLPGSRVVKAFNTIFAEVLHADQLDRAGQRISLFVASDDAEATQAVMAFGAQIGLGPVDAGPLKSARHLEAIAHLNIQLAVGQGDGMNTAIIYHRAA